MPRGARGGSRAAPDIANQREVPVPGAGGVLADLELERGAAQRVLGVEPAADVEDLGEEARGR